MRNPILSLAAASLLAVAASAQAALPRFQYELMGGLTSTSADTNPDIDITEVDLFGTYFLRPVEVADHPWNEAAFLEHSSAVTANLGYTKFEISTFDADGFSFGAGFRYADKDTPLAGEFSVSIGNLDGDLGVDVDQTTLGGRLGYWLQPNVLVGGEVAYDHLDAGGLLDIEQLHIGAFGKIVHDLGEGRAIAGEALFGINTVDVGTSSDTNVEVQAAGDYYFEPRYSVGALLGMSFGDSASDEGVTLGVRGSAWLSPSAAVDAGYSRFNASDSAGSDQDEFTIAVRVRF